MATNPKAPTKKRLDTYALLDQGSTRSFCTRRLVKDLELKGRQTRVLIETLQGKNLHETDMVSLMLKGTSTRAPSSMIHQVIVVEDLPGNLARSLAEPGETAGWNHLKDLEGIGPHRPSAHVDLLIGLDAPGLLTPLEVRAGREGDPFATRTRLGWTINGPLPEGGRPITTLTTCATEPPAPETELIDSLRRLWEMEDPAGREEETALSRADHHVLELWRTSNERVGPHYQLPIPFKDSSPDLPNNKGMALRRLMGLRGRLMKNAELHRLYTAEMNKLIAAGHAELVQANTGAEGRTWYLPHHPVTNPNKPGKLRIVYDCAAAY